MPAFRGRNAPKARVRSQTHIGDRAWAHRPSLRGARDRAVRDTLVTVGVATKPPADELRALGAPRDLTEWVRKLPPATAARSAWVDATRADWMPYLAVVRGLPQDTILRAVCACALDIVPALSGAEADRVLAVLRDTADRGRAALATTEADLADLKLAIVAKSHQTQPTARPPWMYWAELVLELARSASRGNMLVGMSMAMRLLANANTIAKPNARPAHMDLVARLRDKLMLGGLGSG
jgi:hypothetical protein